MSYMRCSKNYSWNSASVLGQGAYGIVYRGSNRTTRKSVAIKTFKSCLAASQMREFEVLQRVDHENIVNLIAIEYELRNREPIIIMELCTGGSLWDLLHQPRNINGFGESEFLLVLRHVTAGMKHLRDNNLVHRDLKPANIMKYIRYDGKTIYKLSDFGTARKLRDNQNFQTICGTEEYLHPDLYGHGILGVPGRSSFDATADLWSIGVTLYQVATGDLPFRPYGGRDNPRIMHYITAQKPSGYISGIQTERGGRIIWCSKLPSNCRLSDRLKRILTPLLAGLLEADSRKTWSFNRYFNEVQNLLATYSGTSYSGTSRSGTSRSRISYFEPLYSGTSNSGMPYFEPLYSGTSHPAVEYVLRKWMMEY